MELDLRPATFDDASLVADLYTARTPDDPSDEVMLAYWWAHSHSAVKTTRLLAERDGRAIVFVAAGHEPFAESARRFGWVHAAIHPDGWDAAVYKSCIDVGERWLRSVGAETSLVRPRADFEQELGALGELGYREVRRNRLSELDLVTRRSHLLAGAERSRADMRRQGIRLITLADDGDPETLRLVHELETVSSHDIPTSVPVYIPPFDEWQRSWFENPAVRRDRFWIARLGDEVAGMSLIEYPPVRGIPFTAYTGTSPRFRGRGIARALKYETVAQAIALGATRLRTVNDSENAPILRVNMEMGYQQVTPFIELHRDLSRPGL